MEREIMIENIWFALPEAVVDELELHQRLYQNVFVLRSHQKNYFKNKDLYSLNQCKIVEKIVDSLILEIQKKQQKKLL